MHRLGLEHFVDQRFAALETPKITDEVFDDPQGFISMSAADMWSDETVRG